MSESSTDEKSTPADHLEAEGEIAADYLEELLEIADLDGDIDMDVEGDRATVSIVGADLPQLVGRDGEVLEALQELTRLAVYRETGERSRLMLDVSGHRANRRTELEKLATDVIARVRESGQREELDPMSPFERKVVHDAVAEGGLTSESEGVEPKRYVVVLPATGASAGKASPAPVAEDDTEPLVKYDAEPATEEAPEPPAEDTSAVEPAESDDAAAAQGDADGDAEGGADTA